MRRKLLVLMGLGIFVSPVPVWAHHAFAAEFDEKKPITLHGVVTKWELVNPHSWIHIAVKQPDGNTALGDVTGVIHAAGVSPSQASPRPSSRSTSTEPRLCSRSSETSSHTAAPE